VKDLPHPLIPADAGIQTLPNCTDFGSGKAWVPASAGTSGCGTALLISLKKIEFVLAKMEVFTHLRGKGAAAAAAPAPSTGARAGAPYGLRAADVFCGFEGEAGGRRKISMRVA
jgi:hypothetical protein